MSSLTLVSAALGQEHSPDTNFQEAKPVVDDTGAVHLPPIVVPFSSFGSPEAKTDLIEWQKFLEIYSAQADSNDITKLRRMFAEYLQPALRRTNTLYPVDSTPSIFGGVYTDVITPREGISPKSKNRVLINLHGGGFLFGARVVGAMESIPVSSLGKIKVVTIDYREGPEYKFPAASEDVVVVYRELLKSYKPKHIGIFGCSAGGLLTAEAVAWIQRAKLPAPGAIGIFCASAGGWSSGDSAYVAPLLTGLATSQSTFAPPHPEVANSPYFADADLNDPMVSPIRSPCVLSKFPPTLIITSTRDVALSSAVYTHTRLTELGVNAELHVWEAMRHGFFTVNPDLPESKEVWRVVIRFFDKHLGTE